MADAAASNAEAKPTRTVVRIVRISGTGSQILGGAIQSLDPNSALRGELWRGSPDKIGIAGRMMTDPHVRQSVGYRTAPLCSATWRFRPASSSPRDREAATFATWAFLQRLPWKLLVKRIVRGWSRDGFSLNEMTDDWVDLPRDSFPLHPGGGRGIVPTGVHEVPASTVYRWTQAVDEPSRLLTFEQYVPGTDIEKMGYRTIPADRLLRWTLDQEGANFEGLPLLRSAYPAWKMKVAFMTIAAIKHERRGVGVPSVEMGADPSDPDKAAVEQALAGMRSNEQGYLLLPNGWKFTWEGGSQNDETNIDAAIAACNQDIAVNASAGFMMLGLTGKSGSYALGATQQGQYHLAVAEDAAFFSTGWNLGYDGWSPVARIVRLNYGPDVGVPVLEARNLPTSPWDARLDRLVRVRNAGLVRPDARLEDEIREMLELDPYDPDSAFDIGGVFGSPPAKDTGAAPGEAPAGDGGSDPTENPTGDEPPNQGTEGTGGTDGEPGDGGGSTP